MKKTKKKEIYSHDFYFSSNFRAHITTVEYEIDQPKESTHEGIYVCNATSTSGFDLGEITVDILGRNEFIERRICLFENE